MHYQLMIPLDVRLANFLGTVAFVADKEIQRAVWIDKVPGITSIISIGELYCQFFDDNDMDGFIKDEMDESPLSTAQKSAIVQFSGALGVVEKLPSYADGDDGQTIESREWNALVKCAKGTLVTFAEYRVQPLPVHYS